MESDRGVDADVVACVIGNGMACVNLVMIRSGRHVGDRSFFPQNAAQATAEEVVEAFLDQHYVEQPRPPLVVSSSPVQGERRVWFEMAAKNAALTRSRSSGCPCRGSPSPPPGLGRAGTACRRP